MDKWGKEGTKNGSFLPYIRAVQG